MSSEITRGQLGPAHEELHLLFSPPEGVRRPADAGAEGVAHLFLGLLGRGLGYGLLGGLLSLGLEAAHHAWSLGLEAAHHLATCLYGRPGARQSSVA